MRFAQLQTITTFWYLTIIHVVQFRWFCSLDGNYELVGKMHRRVKLKKMAKYQKDVKMSKRCQNDVKCQKVKHTDYGGGSQKK